MAIRDVVKVSRKTFFDPKAWIGWNQLKYESSTIFSVLRDLFTVPTPAREETFDQALLRLNVDEANVTLLIKRYWHFAMFFVILFFLTFAYAFFLLFSQHTILGWVLGLAVCSFFLGQAFRFHFWYYQLKVRRLGVTFDEWKKAFLGVKE